MYIKYIMYIYNMEATIINLNNSYEIVKARNLFSLSKKLLKMRINISEVDLLFISMSAGYTQINQSSNRKTQFRTCRIKIENK